MILAIVGVAVAFVGACMWAENVKRRKAREATKDDHPAE
jgi:hypothetical protein